jgi:hypothetical protein
MLMVLEVAGVAAEDVLQDARATAAPVKRLRKESTTASARAQDCEVPRKLSAQYRSRIAVGVAEVEREGETLRQWQEQKEREQRRIAEAASACVSA